MWEFEWFVIRYRSVIRERRAELRQERGRGLEECAPLADNWCPAVQAENEYLNNVQGRT